MKMAYTFLPTFNFFEIFWKAETLIILAIHVLEIQKKAFKWIPTY